MAIDMIGALVLVLFAVAVRCEGGALYRNIQTAIQKELNVFRELNGLETDQILLSGKKGPLPYRETDRINESTCGRNLKSCLTTTFLMHHQLLGIDDVSFNISTFMDAKTTTEEYPARISIKQTRSVMYQTTKGWQVTVQASPYLKKRGGGPKIRPGISQDVEAKYFRGEATQATVAKEYSLHHDCPPQSHCAIITLTFHLVIKGTCRIVPNIICNGKRLDACAGFGMTRKNETGCYYTDTPNAAGVGGKGYLDSKQILGFEYDWETCDQCDQYYQYRKGKCRGRARYLVKPCEIQTVVLKDDWTPHTHTIFESIGVGELSAKKKRSTAPGCGETDKRVYVEPLVRD
ncbi:hypothetical protein DCS_00171 [Drechmeria coniospora]|uniref:Uncharacterized protein n=1 Tax=Drechmeria coniospora TaxID=98403 RepID=A0A151GPK7_DRECN|nr:hypothetical protein DCS_00171 [Drechmeria coniospora]KYK59044.1 hypothetical protein DCS_00171 [Drechmeria coniospora]